MGRLVELANSIREGDRSAKDTIRAMSARRERIDHRINAFLSNNEDAIKVADDLDERRSRGAPLPPLAGVPVAVKDNLCTRSMKTTCGSRALVDFEAQYDAGAVSRLIDAGAILFGKTNLDEFAMGSSTENSAFGPTRNPWNLDFVAGGSSGGSAAAVAAGMTGAALGSDTGGSVRQPAAFCGVVGLKPTYGRVSRFGLVAFGSSLDVVGILAQDVEDAAVLLGIIAGHDPRDSTSLREPVPDYRRALHDRSARPRIGWPGRILDGEGLEDDVRRAVMEAVSELERDGAVIVPVDLPHVRYAIACYYLISSAEASCNLARFDGVHYGHRSTHAVDCESLYFKSRGESFGAEVRRRIMLGTFALSAGYHNRYYRKAQQVRTLIRRDYESAFESVDVIATPTTPGTAFGLGEKSENLLGMYLSDVFTVPANLAGIPAISLPCGLDARGLPIGLQLQGPILSEPRLLALGHRFQQRTDHHRLEPPLFAA